MVLFILLLTIFGALDFNTSAFFFFLLGEMKAYSWAEIPNMCSNSFNLRQEGVWGACLG